MTNRIIPISIGAFFTGCLIFGLGHYLIAPRVHGACALNAGLSAGLSAVHGAVYGVTTYTEACK